MKITKSLELKLKQYALPICISLVVGTAVNIYTLSYQSEYNKSNSKAVIKESVLNQKIENLKLENALLLQDQASCLENLNKNITDSTKNIEKLNYCFKHSLEYKLKLLNAQKLLTNRLMECMKNYINLAEKYEKESCTSPIQQIVELKLQTESIENYLLRENASCRQFLGSCWNDKTECLSVVDKLFENPSLLK